MKTEYKTYLVAAAISFVVALTTSFVMAKIQQPDAKMMKQMQAQTNALQSLARSQAEANIQAQFDSSRRSGSIEHR